MYWLGFFEHGELADFSVIRVSQGSVATYVMWWNVYKALHSKFPAESVSEIIFKIG